MKRIIAGGTGFIGRHLTEKWLTAGHEIVIIGRKREKIQHTFGDRVKAVTWQELNREIIKDAQVIINLTGATIGEKRWTEVRRLEILSSRIEATRKLASLCASLGTQSPPLFNASAIGVYGLQQTLKNQLPPVCNEDTVINFQQAPDFLAKIARAWETATFPAKSAGVRVVLMRFGVVLAKHGGALPQITLPFNFGLGGPIGSGDQPFSWVSLVDLESAIEFLIDRTDINGPINIVAPECIPQKQLAHALGKALQRPSFMPTPGFVLKLIFGQMAEELLLKGQHVYPKRLHSLGFQFKYPTIELALKNIYKNT